MLHATRLLLALARSSTDCHEAEVTISSSRGALPATLFRPRRGRQERGPGWVVLHGITVWGRKHPSLLRFARAFASGGATVIIPEIDDWTALRIRTRAVIEAVRAAAAFLNRQPGVEPGRVGVVGFSFGATQALVAAADDDVREHIRTVVGFGGYCELPRLARYMMTGEHEWQGTRHRFDPDPYARWIVAGNYLTRLPGFGELEPVRCGLLRLAEESGRGGLYQPDSYTDPLKAELRSGLEHAHREVWDLLAPAAGQPPTDLHGARELGARLAAAALAAEPLLDPVPLLPLLRVRLAFAHGSTDRLIPFSETLRLLDALPPHLEASATITRLFEHSNDVAGLPPLRYAAESWRMLRFFHRALRPAG
jgi:acetyl esterase/lipase